MQMRMFPQAGFEERIREYFYNQLVNYVLERGEYTQQNLEQKIRDGIIHIIRSAIDASTNKEATILPDDEGHTVIRITDSNCPDKYRTLHTALSILKRKAEVTHHDLLQLTDQISRLDSFKEINPARALLAMAGHFQDQPQERTYAESDVSAATIRVSFYNEMLMQGLLACEKQWINREDLVDQDPQIYFSLPSLTIIEAIQQSQHCTNGIRLLNNSAVNMNNCPPEDNFPVLVKAILMAKEKIKAMTENQLMAVKHTLATDDELPDDLKELQTPELMATVAIIKNMSIEISRSQFFRNMIGEIIGQLLEMIPEQQQPLRLSN